MREYAFAMTWWIQKKNEIKKKKKNKKGAFIIYSWLCNLAPNIIRK